MFLTVYTELLTMLMASLARDADALGSIKVEVEPRRLLMSLQSATFLSVFIYTQFERT